MKIKILFIYIFILFLNYNIFTNMSFAFNIKRDNYPIYVVADRLEIDNKSQLANFVGGVKAIQGDLTITSDILKIYYECHSIDSFNRNISQKGLLIDSGGQLRKIVAVGNIKIIQKDRLAIGQKATYWTSGRKILLEGRATVWGGQNQISGEQITIFLDDGRSVVYSSPGKRVAVTISPEKQSDFFGVNFEF